MAVDTLIIEYCDDPPPDENRGRKREALYEALMNLQVGGQGIDLNRSLAAATNYVYRFRVERDRELRFKVRATRPGWSRIWRVK